MRISIIIILISFIISCENSSSKKKEVVKYYPDESYFKNNNLVEINLDSLNMSFYAFSKYLNKIHRKDSLPSFKLKTNKDTLEQEECI